jgi:hypothetical protein
MILLGELGYNYFQKTIQFVTTKEYYLSFRSKKCIPTISLHSKELIQFFNVFQLIFTRNSVRLSS